MEAGHQDDDLERDGRISFPFLRQLDEDYSERDLMFKDELQQSETIKAPKDPTPGKPVIATEFRNRPWQLLKGVSEDNFQQRTRKDGSLYYEVQYNPNATFDSTMIRFTSEMNEKEDGERLRPSIDPSETKRDFTSRTHQAPSDK
ncbi:MAG: hypothetical protein Q9161_002646 [Pseudevernia consocians]